MPKNCAEPLKLYTVVVTYTRKVTYTHATTSKRAALAYAKRVAKHNCEVMSIKNTESDNTVVTCEDIQVSNGKRLKK